MFQKKRFQKPYSLFGSPKNLLMLGVPYLLLFLLVCVVILLFLARDISGFLIVLAYLPILFPSISLLLLLGMGCFAGAALDILFRLSSPAFLLLAGTFILVTERMREYVNVRHFLAPFTISIFAALWTFLFDAFWGGIFRQTWVNPWEPWRFLWFSLLSLLLWGCAVYGLHRGKT